MGKEAIDITDPDNWRTLEDYKKGESATYMISLKSSDIIIGFVKVCPDDPFAICYTNEDVDNAMLLMTHKAFKEFMPDWISGLQISVKEVEGEGEVIDRIYDNRSYMVNSKELEERLQERSLPHRI